MKAKQEEIFVYAVCFTLALTGGIPDDWRERANILAEGLVLVWGVSLFNFMVGGSLNQIGIRPREANGLFGVVFAPFLHADFQHLIGNSLPYLVLGWLLLLNGIPVFHMVSLSTAVIGGLGVWMFGRSHTNHVGASGVIFGYLGFLLTHGFFVQAVWPILISGFVGFFYWRTLYLMIPGSPQMSWEGHLFGFVSGVWVAWLVALPTPEQFPAVG